MFYRNTQPLSCLTFVLCVFRRLFYPPLLRKTPRQNTKPPIDPPNEPLRGRRQRRRTQQIIFQRKSSQKIARKQPKTPMTLRYTAPTLTPFSCYLNKIPASHWSGRWHSGSRASSGGISREGGLRIFQVYKKGRIIFSLITNKKLLDPCPCSAPLPPSLSASLQGDLLSFHLCPWRGCCLLINLINKLNVFNAGNSHHHLEWRLLLLLVLFRVFAKKMCFSFAAPYSFPLFVFLLFSTRSCATSSPAGFINKSQK